MGEKLIVGPIGKGLRNDVTAFNIDNDSFPTLINAYQWRGRVKRKRGTSTLTRLQRFLTSITLNEKGSGTFTIIADLLNDSAINVRTLQPNSQIVLKTLVITFGTAIYTDILGTGTLNVTGVGGVAGTVNYSTGQIALSTSSDFSGVSIIVSFGYYSTLPVMGIEDLNLTASQYPDTLAFDTVYSYFVIRNFPFLTYDVSFYRNPNIDSTNLPGYVRKTIYTPTTWNGQDYQQFWTVNYHGALWATNGIDVPFKAANIGMQFKLISAPGIAIITPGNGTTIPAVADITIISHGLVQGDFVFINEVLGITGINFQTGYVTSADPQAPNLIRVTFPFAILAGAWVSGGIVQYLTNRSDITKDSLRFYDGDPTNGNATNPALTGFHGWVNFAPPLSKSVFSIADKPLAQYYLVGARMIVPFKDRLLFIGPVIQTSSANSQLYLQDTVIYSQNGTPYYTASFTGDPSLPNTIFYQILVPDNQTATVNAYWEDQTGFGGFQSAGIDQPIITVSPNQDALILGFTSTQTKFIYTGNDYIPFNFFLVNSELGSGSTFSAINLDSGVMTRGSRGFVMTNQSGTQRIDLQIPDEVFEIALSNNGNERMCAHRDFINEWVYFTYNSNEINYKFPNRTLQFNYRDNSWAVFFENYTTYGYFYKKDGLTWGTLPYGSWLKWNLPWNAGSSTPLQVKVVCGNQQGFIIMRDDDTNEANSLCIKDITASVVTSPDHSLNNEDYIVISGALGDIGALVNGKIFSVAKATQNTFQLNPTIGSGSYIGGGLIQRMYIPSIQTKQFPVSWGMGRKTRIGVQQYLLNKTNNGQIQLLIFLSQNDESPYNIGKLVPDPSSINNSLIYSTTLFTCPESTNLGLTPANVNLQMPTAIQQQSIWHRINTSLIGDTIQLGFTLSDDQMRDPDFKSQFAEIELHGFILDVTPSMLLS